VGRIKLLGSFAEPQRPIESPGNGTVAMNNVVEGQYVTAGSELATGYDFNQIYVTARSTRPTSAASGPAPSWTST
jgi:hypothetical protein